MGFYPEDIFRNTVVADETLATTGVTPSLDTGASRTCCDGDIFIQRTGQKVRIRVIGAPFISYAVNRPGIIADQ